MDRRKETKENSDKGSEERGLSERYGKRATTPPLNPVTKERGIQGASNVGQDKTSGSE